MATYYNINTKIRYVVIVIPLGGYTLPSSLWHSWGGRNCDFLYIFGIVGDLSWGHLGHIIRYAFEWTGTECHGILRYGKISRVLFVVVVCMPYCLTVQ